MNKTNILKIIIGIMLTIAIVLVTTVVFADDTIDDLSNTVQGGGIDLNALLGNGTIDLNALPEGFDPNSIDLNALPEGFDPNSIDPNALPEGFDPNSIDPNALLGTGNGTQGNGTQQTGNGTQTETGNNNSSSSSYPESDIPYAGIETSILTIAAFIVCAIIGIYTFMKLSDYSNI